MSLRRLALCVTELDPGGAERSLVELAVRVDRTRFEPRVYCLGPCPVAGRTYCVDQLREGRVPVEFLDARGAWDFPRTLARLARCLRRDRPDVLQTFLYHANLLGRLAARAAGVRCVLSGIRVAQRGLPWRLWFDRMTDRLVARHVCVSQAVAEFSQIRGHLPSRKLVVIPNGIDARLYPAQPRNLDSLGVPPDRQVVTFVGRLASQKGLDWLIETAADWLDRLPDCDLLLVGDGPDRPRLQRQAEALGLAGRVHWAGDRSDVPAILSASRLLVLPSRWEGMPNAVLEAMASGLPVVATDVEGVRELLGPNAGPQVVALGDQSAWSRAIVSLVQDRALAGRLGSENRRRAQEVFTWDAVMVAYQQLWESLSREMVSST